MRLEGKLGMRLAHRPELRSGTGHRSSKGRTVMRRTMS